MEKDVCHEDIKTTNSEHVSSNWTLQGFHQLYTSACLSMDNIAC